MAEACRSIARAKPAGKLRVGDVVATPAGDLEENGFKGVFHVVAPESLHTEEDRAAMRGVVSTLLARANHGKLNVRLPPHQHCNPHAVKTDALAAALRVASDACPTAAFPAAPATVPLPVPLSMTAGAGAADAVGASGPPKRTRCRPSRSGSGSTRTGGAGFPEWLRQHKDRRGWVPGVAVAAQGQAGLGSRSGCGSTSGAGRRGGCPTPTGQIEASLAAGAKSVTLRDESDVRGSRHPAAGRGARSSAVGRCQAAAERGGLCGAGGRGLGPEARRA